MTRDEIADIVAKRVFERKNDYYRIALSFCDNRDDSLDAVSEMTLVVLQKYETLKDPEAFTSWSTHILINICRRQLRERKRIVYLDDLETEFAATDDIEDWSPDVDLALASVKPQFREVVIMKEVLDYTFREIAAQLRIPLRTAQSRYNYGLKSLRKKLGGCYEED